VGEVLLDALETLSHQVLGELKNRRPFLIISLTLITSASLPVFPQPPIGLAEPQRLPHVRASFNAAIVPGLSESCGFITLRGTAEKHYQAGRKPSVSKTLRR
jgi:hypothetical protein